MKSLVSQFRADTLESIEQQLERALSTLEVTKGRAQIDSEGLGAVRMLITKSIASVAKIREQIAADETEAA